MHIIHQKDAQSLFLGRLKTQTTNVQQGFDKINFEYNSSVCHTRINSYLDGDQVSEYISNGLEISTKPAKVYKLFLKLSRKVPVLHWVDTHWIEFLFYSLDAYSWSHEPLFWVATISLSSKQWCVELGSSYEVREGGPNSYYMPKCKPSIPCKIDEDDIMKFAGQGRHSHQHWYKNHKSFKRQHDFLLIAIYFNWKNSNHMAKNCTKPRNMAKDW